MEPPKDHSQRTVPDRPTVRHTVQPTITRQLVQDVAGPRRQAVSTSAVPRRPTPLPLANVAVESPQSSHSTNTVAGDADKQPVPPSIEHVQHMSIPPVPDNEQEAVPALPDDEDLPPPRRRSGYAGLVGVVVFLALTTVSLGSFVPGTIRNNLPGDSQNYSTGEQSIGCTNDVGALSTTLTYDSKKGFPLVYSYTTTSTIRGTCDGTPQTVTGGHTSQFSLASAAVDVLLCGLLATIFAKLWRVLYHARYG